MNKTKELNIIINQQGRKEEKRKKKKIKNAMKENKGSTLVEV